MPRGPKRDNPKTSAKKNSIKVLRGDGLPLEPGTVFRVLAVGEQVEGAESPWVTIQPVSDTGTTLMVRRSWLQISDEELAACG